MKLSRCRFQRKWFSPVSSPNLPAQRSESSIQQLWQYPYSLRNNINKRFDPSNLSESFKKLVSLRETSFKSWYIPFGRSGYIEVLNKDILNIVKEPRQIKLIGEVLTSTNDGLLLQNLVNQWNISSNKVLKSDLSNYLDNRQIAPKNLQRKKQTRVSLMRSSAGKQEYLYKALLFQNKLNSLNKNDNEIEEILGLYPLAMLIPIPLSITSLSDTVANQFIKRLGVNNFNEIIEKLMNSEKKHGTLLKIERKDLKNLDISVDCIYLLLCGGKENFLNISEAQADYKEVWNNALSKIIGDNVKRLFVSTKLDPLLGFQPNEIEHHLYDVLAHSASGFITSSSSTNQNEEQINKDSRKKTNILKTSLKIKLYFSTSFEAKRSAQILLDFSLNLLHDKMSNSKNINIVEWNKQEGLKPIEYSKNIISPPVKTVFTPHKYLSIIKKYMFRSRTIGKPLSKRKALKAKVSVGTRIYSINRSSQYEVSKVRNQMINKL